MGPVYCLDTNTIVILQRYLPADVHVGVWEQLEDLISEGRARLPREVYDELMRVEDGCANWASAQPGFIVETSESAIIAVATEITRSHPGWVREQQNAADPWLIAHAKVGDYVVVSNERRRGPGVTDAKLGIPNVADEHRVVCITFNDLARNEGWRFERT